MSLKKPYSVPDGYFEDLQMRLNEIPQQQEEARVPAGIGRLAPYLALAACFLFAYVVGSLFIKKPVGVDAVDYEQMRYADIIPYNEVFLNSEDLSDAVSEEDLIEYLIATNTSADLIAYETNE